MGDRDTAAAFARQSSARMIDEDFAASIGQIVDDTPAL
jgi:hypothetical protein